MENVIIRQEKETDYNEVFSLTELAFRSLEISDHTEQFLVERLRKSDAFIPELSLVAEMDNKIVGYILLTKLIIRTDNAEIPSLSLAPISVHPDFQRKGIGGMLINKVHFIARELGFQSVILVGHPDYYPRFGYRKASEFGVSFPFDAPDDACMAMELSENALKNANGVVEYPKEFWEQNHI